MVFELLTGHTNMTSASGFSDEHTGCEPDPLLMEMIHREIAPPDVVRTVTSAQAFETFWQQQTCANVSEGVITHVSGGRQSSRDETSRRYILTTMSIMAGIGLVWGVTTYTRPTTAPHMYSTMPGQQSTIDLGDGSRMTLAPATTARVSADRIEVAGQVYFQVVASDARPVVVRTSDADVRVLGTAFTVRRYATDRGSQITVDDGKVMVQGRRHAAWQHTVLTAGMTGQIADSTIVTSATTAPTESAAWTQGRLVFRAIPLSDVLADLSRAYGTEVRVEDSVLARQRMTLTISVRTESLQNILNVVTEITDAHYTKVGTSFVVAPGRGVTSRSPRPPLLSPQEKQYGR
jgi:transmembrane sensor